MLPPVPLCGTAEDWPQWPITRQQHNSYWLAWHAARRILLLTAHYITGRPERHPTDSKGPKQIRQLSKRVRGGSFVGTVWNYASAPAQKTQEWLMCTLHLMRHPWPWGHQLLRQSDNLAFKSRRPANGEWPVTMWGLCVRKYWILAKHCYAHEYQFCFLGKG